MLRELRPGLCYVLCGASRRIAARATWASLEHFGLLGNYFLGFYEGLRDNNAACRSRRPFWDNKADRAAIWGLPTTVTPYTTQSSRCIGL